MKRTDIEDTTANREATDSDATRPRDGRDPFENARDTRDDVDEAPRTASNGGVARAEAADAADRDMPPNDADADSDSAKNRRVTAENGSDDTGKSLLPSDSLSTTR